MAKPANVGDINGSGWVYERKKNTLDIWQSQEVGYRMEPGQRKGQAKISTKQAHSCHGWVLFISALQNPSGMLTQHATTFHQGLVGVGEMPTVGFI